MTSVDRIQGLSGSLAVKTPCRVATTANITLSGEQTIDAVAVVDGDRVLVKNQTDTTENGIYNVSTGHWTRALDFDGANDVVDGTMVYARAGTANAELFFRVNGTEPITPGDVAISLAPANPLATVSSFAATLLDDADAAAARSTLGAAGLSVENTFTALATFALGLTVAGAAFASLGIQDDATARALHLTGSGANHVTVANSATNPTIGTSGGALGLSSATGIVALSSSAAIADIQAINTGAGYASFSATSSGTVAAYMFLNNATTGALARLTATNAKSLIIGTGTSANSQVSIEHTASADRYITLTGSNGGNPTIGTSAGNLALSNSTILLGTGTGTDYLSVLSQTAQVALIPMGSSANVATGIYSKGASGVFFATGVTPATQVNILATASANRYITLTGSNGGNPTIGTSAGSLAISSQVSGAGAIISYAATATPAGGLNAGFLMGTGNLGLYWGSGAPTCSAAKGSLYLRSDGTTTNDRMYVCITAGVAAAGSWAAVTTAA